MGKKLYVGNLTYGTTDATLTEMFTPYGTVQSAQVITDRDTGRSKGFGFVEMGSDQRGPGRHRRPQRQAGRRPQPDRQRGQAEGGPRRRRRRRPIRRRRSVAVAAVAGTAAAAAVGTKATASHSGTEKT